MSDKKLPWWASPVGINLGFLLPMLAIIYYVGESRFDTLTVRGIWFLTEKYVVLGVVMLAATSFGGWIGSQIVGRPALHRVEDQDRWNFAALVVGSIALLAYVVFFKNYITHPKLLWALITGAYRPDRTVLEETAGITSLNNMAPVFFSIYAYRLFTPGPSLKAHMHLFFIALLLLTALRVYAWSERIALVEVALPLGLAGAMRLNQARGKLPRLISSMGPIIALPMLILYFGIAEYFRSWTASLYNGKTSFWEFALGRLGSYYITSLNNGAALLSTGDWPTFQFQYTVAWIYKMPVLGVALRNGTNAATASSPFAFLLDKFEDPEFNNPSGIFSVVYDLGIPLGIAYFALLGLAGGVLYRSYRSGSLVGVLLYPLVFVSFLEVFRYAYLGESRAFTWFLGTIIALMIGRHFSIVSAKSSSPIAA